MPESSIPYQIKVLRLVKLWIVIHLFISIFSATEIFAQSFTVIKAPFSSSVSEDFAPVFYKNGLVYCSNSINSPLVSIKSEHENLFNLVYTEHRDSGNWKTPVLFSEELTTILNEGPATFTPDEKTIYYARNIQTEGKLRKINDPSNTLGIYCAEIKEGRWSDITAFDYNSTSYSTGTPALSADGNRLYFASDKPGGYGGTDLYYCERIDEKWSKPVNLGPIINSAYNESYPFVNEADRLFFASDKSGGFGGKDIYYSLEWNGQWINPIHLDKAINSENDDFGLITDKNFEWGYFSSDRKNGTNIYSFKTNIPQFDICEEEKPYHKCFDFFDERFTDTLHLEYEWDFGHGRKLSGIKVRQCFDQPGSHSAVLTIIHHLADSTFQTKSEYHFTIESSGNTMISVDKNRIAEQPVHFRTINRNVFEKETTYVWNFGQGFNNPGDSVNYSFPEPGNYLVKLGIIEKNDKLITQSKQCRQTTFRIYADIQQMITENYSPIIPKSCSLKRKNEIASDHNAYILHTYLPADFSPTISDSIASLFFSLPVYYLSFNDNGYPSDASQSVIRLYLEILKKFSDTKLIIAIHQNQRGSQRNNDTDTRKIAENMNRFCEEHNISQEKIECIAYGDSRPVFSINTRDSQYLNKRIEFILLNE